MSSDFRGKPRKGMGPKRRAFLRMTATADRITTGAREYLEEAGDEYEGWIGSMLDGLAQIDDPKEVKAAIRAAPAELSEEMVLWASIGLAMARQLLAEKREEEDPSP